MSEILVCTGNALLKRSSLLGTAGMKHGPPQEVKAVEPKAKGLGTLLGVRIPSEQLALLDAWIEAQPEPKPSRPEAVRRLLTATLIGKARRARRNV